MKDGAWIEARTGAWHWIDEHADWIRRTANARSVGLPEEAVNRIAAMPRRHRSGAERNAILLAAMSEGELIRFRGHGAFVTFEATLAIGTALQAAARFMQACLGPLTHVCFNQLPAGPSVCIAYQDLKVFLEARDLSPLLRGLPTSSQPPHSSAGNPLEGSADQ